MKREDIIESLLRNRQSNFSNRAEAEHALNCVLNAITKGLRRKPRKIVITGFGTFRVVKRNARKGVNPNTGETIVIAPSVTVKFKAGKDLKRQL